MFHNLSDVIYFLFLRPWQSTLQTFVSFKSSARLRPSVSELRTLSATHHGASGATLGQYIPVAVGKWEIWPLFSNKNRTNCVYLFSSFRSLLDCLLCLIASVIQCSFLPGLFCFLIFKKARSQDGLMGCRQGCSFWIVFVWTHKYCCNIIVRDVSC